MAYILFADDEPKAVQIAAAYLTGQGHRCVVVRNGLDALAQVSEEVPDILVTDLIGRWDTNHESHRRASRRR